MVEDAGLDVHPSRTVFHATLHGSQLLGFQVFVGLVSSYAVVQLGERRHAQRLVIRGIHLPVVAYPVAGVDARIDGKRHLVPRVLNGDEACGEREVA